MYYFKALDILPNTVQSSPEILTLPLGIGIIDFIEIEFPAGCMGLVNCIVLRGAQQIIPWNPQESLYGNDRTFHIPLNYPVDAEPTFLEIWAWNGDDTYTHSLSIAVAFSDSKSLSQGQKLLEM